MVKNLHTFARPFNGLMDLQEQPLSKKAKTMAFNRDTAIAATKAIILR
jgi:hypothetical protein